MRKFCYLFLCAAVLVSLFAGCGKKDASGQETLPQAAARDHVGLPENVPGAGQQTGEFTPVDPSQLLTMDQAQQIALDHAGLKAENVTGIHTVIDIENGRQIYEVEFREGHWEYDYEIDAATGQILDWDKDM